MIISIQSKWKIINPDRLANGFYVMFPNGMSNKGYSAGSIYMNDDILLVSGVNICVLGVDYLPTKSDLSLEFCCRNIVGYKGFG